MKPKLPNIILSLFFILSSLFMIHSPANAQESARVITIVPPTREIILAPGEKTEGTLKVINDSEEPITFNATIRDYVVNDNAGTPEILPPNTLSNRYSAAAWIAPVPDQFTIAPHARQELTYYIQIPSDARPGGHYAAVVYQPTDIIGVSGTGTGVQTQIGTLFYINVKGNISEDAAVKQFNVKGFNEYGPVNITTEILNKGDLHIKPIGTITVKNIFGQTVSTKKIEEHNIFPDRSFVYKNTFGKKWMLGYYTATLTTTYGQNSNLPLIASASFIIFPWKVASIALLVVIIVILALIALERKKKHGHPTETPSMPTI